MNCEGFQKNLLDYVDDALSPTEKAVAQSHLAGCSACRELVQDEWLIKQVLSGRLRETVDTVMLDAHAQQRMADAVLKEVQNARNPKKTSPFPPWARLAIPVAATACLILISGIWLGRGFIRPGELPQKKVSSPSPVELEVPVHVSYSATHFTFHKEGPMVVDALTSDTRMADGTLLAKTIDQTEPVYDH